MNIKVKEYYKQAFEKQDGASLAVFRIIIGILLMKDVPVIQYTSQHGPDSFSASFYGFEWVQADPTLIALCINFLPLTVFCIIFGLFYRLAMPLTTLILAYLFLISPEYYLNHYYMLILFCTLMSFMPASKTWSLDALIQKSSDKDTGVPNWYYWILKLQTEVILIYAGLVKINWDWFGLQPLSTWFTPELYKLPVIGWLFFFDAPIVIGAYGVILLHTVGAPLLYFKKTRPWVFALYVCFHMSNSIMFDIGIFPYMTIAATLLFFSPDWPRKILKKIEPLTSASISVYKKIANFKLSRKVTILLLGIWILFQIINPLPVLFTSNLKTAWTGHRHFFTWRMMLNDKRVYNVSYVVHMPERRRIEFVPLEEHLNKRQCFRFTSIPNMAVQFANYLEEYYSKKYDTDIVKVYTYTDMSINFREPELWADPTVNLAAQEPKYGVHEWLEPVDNPFRTWKEYLHSPQYIPPTYRKILKAMQLPLEENIAFDKQGVTLDARPVLPKCKNKIYPS